MSNKGDCNDYLQNLLRIAFNQVPLYLDDLYEGKRMAASEAYFGAGVAFGVVMKTLNDQQEKEAFGGSS